MPPSPFAPLRSFHGLPVAHAAVAAAASLEAARTCFTDPALSRWLREPSKGRRVWQCRLGQLILPDPQPALVPKGAKPDDKAVSRSKRRRASRARVPAPLARVAGALAHAAVARATRLLQQHATSPAIAAAASAGWDYGSVLRVTAYGPDACAAPHCDAGLVTAQLVAADDAQLEVLKLQTSPVEPPGGLRGSLSSDWRDDMLGPLATPPHAGHPINVPTGFEWRPLTLSFLAQLPPDQEEHTVFGVEAAPSSLPPVGVVMDGTAMQVATGRRRQHCLHRVVAPAGAAPHPKDWWPPRRVSVAVELRPRGEEWGQHAEPGSFEESPE